MSLIIGCPIYKRDWILRDWFKCILNQSYPFSDIGFVFQLAPDDNGTLSVLEEIADRFIRPDQIFEAAIRNDLAHFEHEEDTRTWSVAKYENLATMRNSLLKRVTELQPDYYFSLDSDILLRNPNTIELLIAHIKNGAKAVSPLMFMTPITTQFPGVMNWAPGHNYRAYRESVYPYGTFFQTDVIMAAKMMSKEVYSSTMYKTHPQGEDVGWSEECARLGIPLHCASYVYAYHIMSRSMFEQFKSHGDQRDILSYGIEYQERLLETV